MFYRSKYPAKSTVPGITYHVNDVVAASLMAYKQNGNKIEKYDIPDYTPAEGDTSRTANPRIVSNKSIIIDVLKDTSRITNADRNEAVEAIQYCQGRITMSILSNKKVSSFMKDMVAVLELPEVPVSKIGMLVYIASTFYTGKVRETVDEKTSECQYTSQALGKVGDKITVNFTLLRSGYLQTLDCFTAFGTDDSGNLISFLTKHKHLCASMTLTGKIKNAAPSEYHKNAIVNALNYVKEVS